MADATSALIRERHLAYLARMKIDSTLFKYGALTIDVLAELCGYSRDFTAAIIDQMQDRNDVAIAGTVPGRFGTTLTVYGTLGSHVPYPTTRDKLLDLLQENGDSTCSELARELGLSRRLCRYHLEKLRVARKVVVVGTCQRHKGRAAFLWSADPAMGMHDA